MGFWLMLVLWSCDPFTIIIYQMTFLVNRNKWCNSAGNPFQFWLCVFCIKRKSFFVFLNRELYIWWKAFLIDLFFVGITFTSHKCCIRLLELEMHVHIACASFCKWNMFQATFADSAIFVNRFHSFVDMFHCKTEMTHEALLNSAGWAEQFNILPRTVAPPINTLNFI